MEPELKQKWLDALKSGKYTKGRHALRPSCGSYCCLGVLANIIDPGAWKYDDYTGEWAWRNGSVSSFLTFTDELTEIQGLSGVAQTALMSLNDSSPNWNRVIEYIEERL